MDLILYWYVILCFFNSLFSAISKISAVEYVCIHVYIGLLIVVVFVTIYEFLLLGMCWEEKYPCDSVPTT
jgi:hypothetical protein